MDVGLYGWNKNVNFYQSNVVFINKTAPATTNYGVLNIGDGPFDGVSTGKFVGSTNGTLIAGNVASTFTGKLIDLQLAGNAGIPSLFSVDYGGSTKIYGQISAAYNTGSSSYNFSVGFSGDIHTSSTINAGNFTVDASGNVVSSATKNLLKPFIDATADYGILNFGSTSNFFNGISGGHFVGNSAGTYIAIDADSGFTGNFLDFQVFGVTRFSINGTGTVTLPRPPAVSANTALLMLGSGGFAGGGAPNFVGSVNGTVIGVNANSLNGDFIALETDGVSWFNISGNGRITSVSNFGISFNHNSGLGSNNDFFVIGNAGGSGALQGDAGNQQSFVSIRPNINQGSTASYTGLEVDVTETTIGSGTNLLLDLKVGGVSKFSVSNLAKIVARGVTMPDDLLAMEWMQVS